MNSFLRFGPLILSFLTLSLYGEPRDLVYESDTAVSLKLYRLGLKKISEKNFSEAIRYFDSAIDNDPNNTLFYTARGDANRSLKNYSEAIKDYSFVLISDPNYLLALKGRADAYRLSKNCLAALLDYEKAISHDPIDEIMYFGSGSCKFEINKVSESVADFTKCIEIRPSHPAFYFKRGLSYYVLSMYENAIMDFGISLKLDKADTYNVRYYIAKSYINLTEKGIANYADSAILNLNKCVLNSSSKNDPLIFQALGVSYTLKKDSSNAKQNFERSAAIKSDPETYFRWGASEYNFGNYKSAIEKLEYVITNTEDTNSIVYYYLGLSKANLKDTIGAIQAYDKALSIKPDYEEVLESKISMLFPSKKYYLLVLSELDKLIERRDSPEDKAHGYSYKALVLFNNAKLDDALESVNLAISLDEKEPSYYLLRAVINAVSGFNADKVITEMDKAIKLDPSYQETYILKAIYLANIKQYTKACETISFAIKIGAKIPTETKKFICTGKISKNSKSPQLFVPITPRFKK